MSQPFDSANQLIDQISEAVFDAVENRFLGTFVGFPHALRLTFSMSPRSTESTPGDDFEFRAVPPCDRAPERAGVLHTCMFI